MEKGVPHPVGPGPNVHKGRGPEPAPLWLLCGLLRPTASGRLRWGAWLMGQSSPGSWKGRKGRVPGIGGICPAAAGRQAAQPWPNG